MMKKIRRLEIRADKLLQIKYVGLNPKCLVCNNPTSEMHHFIPKSQSNNLRYDPDNLIPLCKSCHARHHLSGDPTVVGTIIKMKGIDWFDSLQKKRHIICKHNLSYMTSVIEKYET